MAFNKLASFNYDLTSLERLVLVEIIINKIWKHILFPSQTMSFHCIDFLFNLNYRYQFNELNYRYQINE